MKKVTKKTLIDELATHKDAAYALFARSPSGTRAHFRCVIDDEQTAMAVARNYAAEYAALGKTDYTYYVVKVLHRCGIEDGKVVDVSHCDESPTGVRMFPENIHKLYDLKKSALTLLLELAGMANGDKNIIITPSEREKISKRTGLNTQVIYNATRELVSSGLLVRIINSVYMIDPGIFAVGSDPKVIENRKKFNELQKINMQVHYTKDGRKIEVSLE